MRSVLLVTAIIAAAFSLHAQNTFELKEGDTTYVMQEYYMVYLIAGDNREQDSVETARIQQAHLAHMDRMAAEGYLSIAGPFGDDGDVRGICIYNTVDMATADSLVNLDPAVQEGRLKVEVRPWWAAKGSVLK